MTKRALINKVAEESGLNVSQSKRAINNFLRNISQELEKQRYIDIRNFGTLKVEYHKPRRYYSPVTGQFTEVRTPVLVSFRASKKLKIQVTKG